MTLKDGVILEFLAEQDMELPPKPLYRNLNRHGIEIGYSTTRDRLAVLEEYGLLHKDEDGYYEVSNKGMKWLDDELDATDLPS